MKKLKRGKQPEKRNQRRKEKMKQKNKRKKGGMEQKGWFARKNGVMQFSCRLSNLMLKLLA
jgi:hypothetical protein